MDAYHGRLSAVCPSCFFMVRSALWASSKAQCTAFLSRLVDRGKGQLVKSLIRRAAMSTCCRVETDEKLKRRGKDPQEVTEERTGERTNDRGEDRRD